MNAYLHTRIIDFGKTRLAVAELYCEDKIKTAIKILKKNEKPQWKQIEKRLYWKLQQAQ